MPKGQQCPHHQNNNSKYLSNAYNVDRYYIKHVLTHVHPFNNLRGRDCYHQQFTDEETGTEKLRHLPKVIKASIWKG